MSVTESRETARSNPEDEYNYRHFGPEYYDFRSFDGPVAGDEAPDFAATTLDSGSVSLSDYRGRWVVLETGSLTCPITDSKVHAMDRLAGRFDDVEFVLLYTREAHPGERREAHRSFEEKLERARTFVAEYDVERTVLVDDLEGTAHRQYGGMPNSVHVINPDGVVVMRGDWNDVRAVESILEERDPDRRHEREIYRGRPLFFTPKKGFVRVLLEAGPRAVKDFVRRAPSLAWMHLRKEFRRKRFE